MKDQKEPLPWQEGRCRCPMWMGGLPSGSCGEKAYGHCFPNRYLRESRGWTDTYYTYGHSCPAHGGPSEDEPRIFQDGNTESGHPMYCAVMPDFVNLQESPAGFDRNPMNAVANLREIAA